MIELEALNALDRSSLIRLADLLEANLLVPPFGRLALQDYVGEYRAESVSACLVALTRAEASPSQIALIMRAFAAGRDVEPDVSELIDVVVSGPDAAAAARDTGVVMRQLFGSARERVLAVGFAIHQGELVFQTLADRLDACQLLEVTLCLDVRREPTNTSLDIQIVQGFARSFVEGDWPGRRLPRVYYDPRSLSRGGSSRSSLHAKCVVIDGSEALVTSANFTEAAQMRNIELGLHVKSSRIAGQIEDHFYTLIRNGYLERLPLV